MASEKDAKQAGGRSGQHRTIAAGQSVFYGGRTYVAGQEDELHAAASAEGAEPLSHGHLAAHGAAFGFGKAKGIEPEDLAGDATIQAGTVDEVLDVDEDAPEGPLGAAGTLTETEFGPGRYTGEKGATGPKEGKAAGRAEKGKGRGK